MTVPAAEATFDVYGLRVRVRGEWPEVVEAVRLDFAWFERAEPGLPPDVEIVVERRPPELDRFGEVAASFVTPRNVVYHARNLTVIDYFGHAVSILDRRTDRLTVQGEAAPLVHEAVYLFLLSRVGEHLDARGLPRLHALGIAGSGGAVAVMLPSGGGKSTLALQALEDPGVRLLSEDTPLLDALGRLHPFPLRIGINATDADLVPEGSVRRIERMEFHTKLALELGAFADRIEREPQALAHLVIGRRSLGRDARLEPLRRSAAVGALVREGVVGVGVYQGMEFVLQRGLRDVGGKLGVAARRARCCGRALARANVWRLTLGRDRDRNWEALSALLHD